MTAPVVATADPVADHVDDPPRRPRTSLVIAFVAAAAAVVCGLAFFPLVESIGPEVRFMCSYGGKKGATVFVGAVAASGVALVLLGACAAARARRGRWSSTGLAWTLAASLWVGVIVGARFLARSTTWTLEYGLECFL